MNTRIPWSEKLQQKKSPQTKRIDFSFSDIPAGSVMFIATPQLVDAYIRQIPKGKQVSVKTLRNDLAKAHQADATCPLTTGIFLRIAAEASYEKYRQTKSIRGITPFWRVIEPGSPLAKKLSCGPRFIAERRKAEGIED